MKKYILHIIIVLIVQTYLFAGYSIDQYASMKRADIHYKNNQFAEAVKVYEDLVKYGYQGTSLYYNLGNSHYRLGKIGYAILYYEKALKLSPNDEDVKHNLALAKLNIKDKVETLPPFFIFNIWENVLASLSVSGWTVFAYIVFILLLLCVVAYFFSRTSTQQRVSFFSGVGVFAVLILVIIFLAVKMNKEFNIKDGIIVSNLVTVKSSPDNSSKDEFVIHEGLKVRLEDKVDNWVKIRLDDGKLGWISEENFKQI